MNLNLFSRRKQQTPIRTSPAPATAPNMPAEPYKPAPTMTMDADPLKRLLQQERFGRLVRRHERLAAHPQLETVFQAAVDAIDEHFALVPEGFITMPKTVNDYPGCPEEDVDTAAFLLARCCVTNEQYQRFVDDGAYENLDLWPKDILPHLIDFVDLTGHAAPRFWRDGRHNMAMADHPVVGICYYEAAAYAAWAGYCLPHNIQWQMAASWRIRSEAQVLRRYPWGDALDTAKCNVWASRLGRTAPVTAYPAGAAPNGVLQLIGNVWEWTDSDYDVTDDQGRQVVGDMLLKEIRGGAFDTYFPSQATSAFRTGLAALSRVHNVGLRCVVDLSNDQAEVNAP
jgi:gamma-glutamyl hercynylcysteine S-oxide synthase